MAQTETNAFRECLKVALADDEVLKRLLTGGVYFDFAPSRNNRTDTSNLYLPVGVINIITAPSITGNAGNRIITEPLIRFIVHGIGRGATITQTCDQAARYADQILENFRFTSSDTDTDAGDAEPFEIRGFRRENAFDDTSDDGQGNLRIRKGGDYRGWGYYLPTSGC